MLIQWFPGHMTKTLRMMDDEIKKVDGVIYVLDARAPYSSLNPEFQKRIQNKPHMYVINKCDLADDRATALWVKHFSRDGNICVRAISTKSGAAKEVYKKALQLLKEKIERNRAKQVNKKMRLMVIGIPNSGKSTLINNLCGNKRAITGDKPGVTRGKQWLYVDEQMELCDTPGSLYPSFENQKTAKNLAYIGSINDNILDKNELALEFLKTMVNIYPKMLEERYKIDASKEPLEIYEQICKNRGFLLRGGDFDYDRGAATILDDFRKGRTGDITLDKYHEIFGKNAVAEKIVKKEKPDRKKRRFGEEVILEVATDISSAHLSVAEMRKMEEENA